MEYGTYDNPYAVPAVQNVSMVESPRHEGGNAVAANSEARVVAEVKAQVLMARQFPRASRSYPLKQYRSTLPAPCFR